jgi:hypothetical protein
MFKRPCYAYKKTPNFSGKGMRNYVDDDIIGYEKRKLKDLGKEFLNASI